MDAELIIILVALGLSVLSGINKSKKKKASGPSQVPLPEPEDDPWASIRKYIENAQHPEDEDYEDYAALQESRGHTPAKAVIQPVADDPYVSSRNKYAEQKQARPVTKSRFEDSNTEPPKTSKPEKTNDLLEDFDLTKAVIYSEILKPRFEEF